jgi:hypothetical protein
MDAAASFLVLEKAYSRDFGRSIERARMTASLIAAQLSPSTQDVHLPSGTQFCGKNSKPGRQRNVR